MSCIFVMYFWISFFCYCLILLVLTYCVKSWLIFNLNFNGSPHHLYLQVFSFKNILHYYNIQNGLEGSRWTQIHSQSWADQLTCNKELLFVIRLNSGLDVVTEVSCSYEMLFISLLFISLKLLAVQSLFNWSAVWQVCFIIIWQLNVDYFE